MRRLCFYQELIGVLSVRVYYILLGVRFSDLKTTYIHGLRFNSNYREAKHDLKREVPTYVHLIAFWL